MNNTATKQNYTIVSGLWNLERPGRDFDSHYIERFKEFLRIPCNMVLFIPKSLEDLVWEYRKNENTFVKIFELEDVKQMYAPHWDNTQTIRSRKTWLNISGEGGWLHNSPQATLEYYNPIVQSKMFLLHDSSIMNPFQSEYFYWLDAGITNTVPKDELIYQKVLDNLPNHTNPFLFLSYPYQAAGEIHGFAQSQMDKEAQHKVTYVCRGGLFGGHKEVLSETNSTYYSLLEKTLNEGFMGTEESLFTIMSYRQPELYKRFMLDENGLISKFTEALRLDNVELETNKDRPNLKIITNDMLDKLKTNLYILTFNFPKQLIHTLEQMKKQPEWINSPSIYVLDNSTDESAIADYRAICSQNGFEYISLGGNTGINRGRQSAAEHFDKSNADYMFFFEDDMTINFSDVKNPTCRNGFRSYIPNLYKTLHKIMLTENFDFLKLSFTEVYMDNYIQCSWYNIPQNIRTRDFPTYDKLPIHGIDPYAPRTNFDRINNIDGVAYASGEVYYANWPMIVSKEGNRKMFLETTWEHPYEQTWMSHMYQKTKEGHINPAVLLASPIFHERIEYYKPEERREN